MSIKSLLVLLIITVSLFSQEEFNFVDSLNIQQKELLDSITKNFSIDDGLDGTIYSNRNNSINLDSKSFYNFAAWYIYGGKEPDYVVDKLRQRNQTYYHAKHYNIAPSDLSLVGDSSAPIKIVAYMTSTCPHCQREAVAMDALINGELSGVANFSMKPVHHVISDYALLAAKEQGYLKDWQLFLAYADIEGRLDEDGVIEAAKKAGLDIEKLKADVDKNNQKYHDIIEKYHTEAVNNDMKYTPTLYFNGYRYNGTKHPLWIIDYINYLVRNGGKPVIAK